MKVGGRSREQEQRGEGGKQGVFWLPGACSEAPRGPHDDIAFGLFFFFFCQNEK